MDNKLKKNYFKFAFGIAGIALWVWFAFDRGEVLTNFSWKLFGIVSCVFLIIIFVNASILRWITTMFNNPLSNYEALLITSIGALANSAGGVPLGTALVFGVLVKKHGFELKDIFLGKVLATVLSVVSLILIVSFGFLLSKKIIHASIFIILASGMLALTYYAFRTQANTIKYLKNGCLLSILGAVFMVLAYCLVIDFYMPSLEYMEQIVFSGMSLLIGISSMATTVGGLQELILGLNAWFFVENFSFGVELGLFIRFCSVASAFIMSLVLCFVMRKQLGQYLEPTD